MKRFFHAFINVLVLTLLITNIARADQLTLPASVTDPATATDVVAPVVTQNNLVKSIDAGEDHTIFATVTDNIAIKSVILFYRNTGHNDYQTKTMHSMTDTDNYAATISADQIGVDGLEYYIQATDSAGNTLLHGYAFSPITVAINSVNSPTANTALTTASKAAPEKEKSYKWLWIGLGVLAVGAIAAGSGGDDNGGSESTTITIDAPVPQ